MRSAATFDSEGSISSITCSKWLSVNSITLSESLTSVAICDGASSVLTGVTQAPYFIAPHNTTK